MNSKDYGIVSIEVDKQIPGSADICDDLESMLVWFKEDRPPEFEDLINQLQQALK